MDKIFYLEGECFIVLNRTTTHTVGVEVPILLRILPKQIEIMTVTLTPENKIETHIRTFNYNDLLLMNNTLNQIMGRNSK